MDIFHKQKAPIKRCLKRSIYLDLCHHKDIVNSLDCIVKIIVADTDDDVQLGSPKPQWICPMKRLRMTE